MTINRPFRRCALLLGPLLLLSGCQAETFSPPVADHFLVLQGADQRGAPGAPLDSTLILRLLDDQGQPMRATAVSWEVIAGGGVVEPSRLATDNDGLISANWTLGLGWGSQILRVTTPDGAEIRITAEAPVLTVSKLVVGTSFGCGIDEDQATWCWGEDWAGTLGDPLLMNTGYSLRPHRIGGDSLHFIELAAGAYHVCGRTAAGEVYCWGTDSDAQLGDGRTGPYGFGSAAPVRVSAIPVLRTIDAGFQGTCGLDLSGALWCWGKVAGEPTRVTPQQLFAGVTFVKIAMSRSYGCGILTDGQVACWGDNFAGQLGRGTTGGNSATLLPISIPIQAADIDAGWDGACAITTVRDLYCWGSINGIKGHDFGEVGSATPTRSAADSPALRISLGYYCGAIWKSASGPRQLCSGWTNDIERFPSITDLVFGSEVMCLAVGTGGIYCKSYSDAAGGPPFAFEGTGIPAP